MKERILLFVFCILGGIVEGRVHVNGLYKPTAGTDGVLYGGNMVICQEDGDVKVTGSVAGTVIFSGFASSSSGDMVAISGVWYRAGGGIQGCPQGAFFMMYYDDWNPEVRENAVVSGQFTCAGDVKDGFSVNATRVRNPTLNELDICGDMLDPALDEGMNLSSKWNNLTVAIRETESNTYAYVGSGMVPEPLYGLIVQTYVEGWCFAKGTVCSGMIYQSTGKNCWVYGSQLIFMTSPTTANIIGWASGLTIDTNVINDPTQHYLYPVTLTKYTEEERREAWINNTILRYQNVAQSCRQGK